MTLNRQGLPTSCPHPPGRPTSSLNGMSRISLAYNLTLTPSLSRFDMFIDRLQMHTPPTTDIHTPEPTAANDAHAHAWLTQCLWRSGFLWGFEWMSPLSFSFFFQSCAFAHLDTPSRHPRTPPPPPGQKLKQPRHCKASTTTMPAPASRPSPTYVPPTVSAHGLWSACNRPPSSPHK